MNLQFGWGSEATAPLCSSLEGSSGNWGIRFESHSFTSLSLGAGCWLREWEGWRKGEADEFKVMIRRNWIQPHKHFSWAMGVQRWINADFCPWCEDAYLGQLGLLCQNTTDSVAYTTVVDFSQFWRLRPGCPVVGLGWRLSSQLAGGWLPSHCILIWQRNMSFLIRALIP